MYEQYVDIRRNYITEIEEIMLTMKIVSFIAIMIMVVTMVIYDAVYEEGHKLKIFIRNNCNNSNQWTDEQYFFLNENHLHTIYLFVFVLVDIQDINMLVCEEGITTIAKMK